MLVAVVLLSEAMVNKSDEEEPAFKFFTKHFSDLRGLLKRVLDALKTVHLSSLGGGLASLSENQHNFLVELSEALIYLMLDFAINETASAAQLQFSFPVAKGEAKQMLILANDFV